MHKIVDKSTFCNEVRMKLKKNHMKIILCHGVFDLIHPGHIIHLEQAKKMGDVLVVSVTAAKYVRKGPGRPYFDDEMRMKFLEALECVDYVLLSESYTVDDIIEAVHPDIYVKGNEYAVPDDDLTGNIEKEKALVETYGGKLCFTYGQTFSSTKLINTAMSGLSDEVIDYICNFKSRHTIDEIREYADRAEKQKILVIGDIIIDKYTYCEIQGLMTKDVGYSARIHSSEEYLGGAAAIARHLSAFCSNVTLMSIIGNEKDICKYISTELENKIELRLFFSDRFETIIKHRYLSIDQKREEYRKIFAVNNVADEVKFENEVISNFKKVLNQEILKYDAVFLCDFGHGLIDRNVIDIIQEKAKFIVLNCQTNSSNHGLNIITKYKRADIFALDQQELKLAFPVYAINEKRGLRELSNYLKGNGWLTRGSKGAYGVEKNKLWECPAFSLNVKDTVGAGDAFYAIAGIFTVAGAPIEVGTFVGNIAGALGANIIGNKEAVGKVDLLKFASTLMNV